MVHLLPQIHAPRFHLYYTVPLGPAKLPTHVQKSVQQKGVGLGEFVPLPQPHSASRRNCTKKAIQAQVVLPEQWPVSAE